MGKLLVAARKHAGMTLLASVAVLGGAGAATAAVIAPTSSEGEVYEAPVVAPETTAPATTTAPEPVAPAPPAPAPVEESVEEPVQSPAPATVDAVTEPAPETIPAPQVNPDGSLPEGWLPPQNPGEPPIAPFTPPPPAEKLPGETGYVPPTD